MMNNKKGFTLIELMVVVGIIGVITAIAVPSFQKFQAKAKQANAKTELSGMYGMEKAFYTEFGHYHANLPLVGYVPDGYPMSGDCPVSGTISASATAPRYYEAGFINTDGEGSAAQDAKPAGIGDIPCDGITSYSATLTVDGSGTVDGVAKSDEFLIVANGKITNSSKADVWTMNQSKLLTNTQLGY